MQLGQQQKHRQLTAVLAGLIAAALWLPATAEASAPAALRCDPVTFQVGLGEGQPNAYQLKGELCARGAVANKTVQVLVHGATYNRAYWDWPQQPALYSYVRYATAAGYATLNLDRLGAGASDLPDGFALTSAANAYSLHQVIQALRTGTITTAHFNQVQPAKIILVGHSFGTYMAIDEVARYADVDGLIASGFAHSVGPGQVESYSALYPVQFDPLFAGRSYPQGYLTTVPGGARGALFYYAPGADPQVIAYDEQTKDAATVGEFSDFYPLGFETSQIHVPVLEVVGDYDRLYCALPSCSQTASLAHEGDYFAPDAHLSVFTLPNAGHDINLHQDAPVWFLAAQVWADTWVGRNADMPAGAGRD